jgi:hypothetical protein
MRALVIVLATACASDPLDAAEHQIRAQLRMVNGTIADDGPPAFDLGSLSAAGPPAGPGVSGGVGQPGVAGGLGSPVSGGIGSPATGGGGIASGPSASVPDPQLVAVACDLFDALFERVQRCSNDTTGVIAQIDQLFKGQTCEAYVEGILQIDPKPIQPGAIELVECMAALFRNTPCDFQITVDMFLQECRPVGS